MGVAHSKYSKHAKQRSTALDLLSRHFQEAFEDSCSLEEMRNLCRNVWPKLNHLDWPQEGSLYTPTINRLEACLEKYRPQDLPYIQGWKKIADNPPSWAKKAVADAALVMVAQLQKKAKAEKKTTPDSVFKTPEGKEIFQEDLPPLPPPPPYLYPQLVTPTAPVVPQPSTPSAPSQPGTSRATPAATVPLGELQADTPVASLSPPELSPAPSTPESAPVPSQTLKETPTKPVSTVEAASGYQVNTRQRARELQALEELRLRLPLSPNELAQLEEGNSSVQILPVRTIPVVVPQFGNDEEGHPRDPTIVKTYNYVPFSTSDLLNWKAHGPSYEKQPDKFLDMLSGIIASQNPTWLDIQQLMAYLMTTEERMQVQTNMEDAAREAARAEGQQDANPFLARLAPSVNPNWDFQSAEGRKLQSQYQQNFLEAVRKGRKRMMNMAKIHDIRQEKDESPGVFLERLQDAYRQYSPLNPEDPNNRQSVVMSFVSQSYPDIRRKLQKIEGFEGMSLAQLKALADKVFVNRDVEEKREERRKMKEKASIMAAVLNPTEEEIQPPVMQSQCFHCGRQGHWRARCPERTVEGNLGWNQNRGRGRGRGTRWRGRGRGQSLNARAPAYQPQSAYAREQAFQQPQTTMALQEGEGYEA